MPPKKFATDNERKVANAARMRLARQHQTEEQRLNEAERKRLARQNQTEEQRLNEAERKRLARQSQTDEQRLNEAERKRLAHQNRTKDQRKKNAERKRLARQNQTEEQRLNEAERKRLARQNQTKEQRFNAAAARRDKRKNETSHERNIRLAKQSKIDAKKKKANLSRRTNDIQVLAEKYKEDGNVVTEHYLGPMNVKCSIHCGSDNFEAERTSGSKKINDHEAWNKEMTTKQVNKQESALANLDKDTEYSQDSFNDVQIKDEPEDAGYDKLATFSDYNSAADSRDSSPLPPVHFENPSPMQRGTTIDKDTEYSQDSFNEFQIKDEPEDAGYDKSGTFSDYNSAADSRDSSALPPVHFENPSPPHVSSPISTSSTQIPLNDLFAGSTVRSQLQGAISSKKMDTIQNIIEGLLKKNETLLAMSDAGVYKPRSHKPKSVQDASTTLSGQSSCSFPVSTSLQAHVHSCKKITDTAKTQMKRPKSPTLRHASVLKDKTNFTHALMESSIIDPEMEKVINVQKHELVCGVGSRSYIEDQSQKMVVFVVNHYWCNFCPYTTTSKSHLVHHTLDHRFACRFCAYESFCRSDIVRHMYKQHPEFEETAGRFYYYTFLSDYLRVISCVEQNEIKGSDEEVDASPDLSLTSPRGRKPSKKSSNLDLEKSIIFTENGYADNSKQTDLLPIPKASKDSDYDMFEMEVEEIREPSQDINSEDPVPEIYSLNHESHNPCSQVRDAVPFPTNLVKVDGPRKNSNPSPSPQPLKNIPTNSRSKICTEKSGRSSNLYWSCGYCVFQSSSQSEIKKHYYVDHIGKPQRYVARIKHKNLQGVVPTNQSNVALKTTGLKSAIANSTDLSSVSYQTSAFSPQSSNNSILSDGIEDLESGDVATSSKEDISSVKVKMKPTRSTIKENAVYTCYHCAYTVRRPSSLKSHIYYKHRGKCLVAVDFDSEHRKHIFFCARDDCTFKIDTPDEFLHHVDQCTPWNNPAQADIEVEPHIRQCLEQTVEFAKNVVDKE
ncbi:hypothetical protein Btru_076804 [Bulinus truncatus]|nr:hypothetical protein Btru_076804 [Bulinus truncatus]